MTTPREQIDQFADENEVELLTADGFDDAIIGIGRQFNKHVVVYDTDVVIQTLITRDNMTLDDAMEFFEYNIVGAYVGENTPMFMERV